MPDDNDGKDGPEEARPADSEARPEDVEVTCYGGLQLPPIGVSGGE